jgi:hypothetical protein
MPPPHQIAGAVLLFAGTCVAAPEPPSNKLLSTALLARDVRTLPDTVRALQGPNLTAAAKAPFAKVQSKIGSFIIRQIEAYPSISECDLQKQLATAFAVKGDGCGGWQESDNSVPRVFASPWGDKTGRRVIVVAYCIWLGFYGTGGYETVLESYIWEPGGGVRRGASLVPPSLSGIASEMEEVCWFADPDRVWVLASGVMSGSSGRTIGGTAAVFEIGPEGGTRVWSAPPSIGNVSAHAHSLDQRWEIEYVDTKRFYAGLPKATLLDIYQIDGSAHTYRRVVHQPLD